MRPILLGKKAQDNQKIGFLCSFFAIWAHQNGPQMVPKGQQVDQMYSTISKLKNKPLAKALPLGPLHYGP
jgi:hypothetical protein